MSDDLPAQTALRAQDVYIERVLPQSDEECRLFASKFAALSRREQNSSVIRLWERALDTQDLRSFFSMGLHLRNLSQLDWAECIFTILGQQPDARHAALYEMAIIAAARFDPELSVARYRLLERERPLSPFWNRTFSHQLALLGRFDEAQDRLQLSMDFEPTSAEECRAFSQLYRYMQRVPREQAVRRAREITAQFPIKQPHEVVQDVYSALRERRPYSMIRLNDGEGALIELDDVEDYSLLRNYHLRAYHQVWFGSLDHIADPHFLAAAHAMNTAITESDCVGAIHDGGVNLEYSQAAPRISVYFDIVRKLEEIAKHTTQRPALCHPLINHIMLADGSLEQMLHAQDEIGLVSCHAALPDALASRFGLKKVAFHKTPGEKVVQDGKTEAFPGWHERIKAELRQAAPGRLYIVAAGTMAKEYCAIIKQAGGVGMDMGSVADIWMKAPTRDFHQSFDRHSLA